MESKRVEVENCMRCPWWMAPHACGAARRKLDVMKQHKGAPDWCPLRTGDVLVTPKKGGE